MTSADPAPDQPPPDSGRAGEGASSTPRSTPATTGRRPVALAAVVLVIALGVLALGAGVVGRLWFGGSVALGVPHFADDTAASGLQHAYKGGNAAMIGGGLAVLDCDADGRPDLYIAGGDGPSALFRNASARGGALAFTRLADPVTDVSGVMGAYPIDIDGDGNVDLAVLRVGGADLLRGLGGCRFERASAAWTFDAPTGWETAFSATWEGTSRLPTLAFGSYVGLDATGDATYDCAPGQLYRPAAGGLGYAAALPLAPGYCPLSMLFSDWDGSGRRDLRIANDRHYYDARSAGQGEEQLWRISPGETPRAYGLADGWVQLQVWGMGIASQDLTGDGLPEVYLTSQADNKLQTLADGPAEPTYRDIALQRGVIGTRPVNGGDPLQSTAWHPEFEDVNNDGLMDLYVSKGNIDQVPDSATRDPSNLYLGQPDGTFSEQAAAAGIVDFARTRGAALADLNGDGLLDLVEVKVDAPVRLLRNVGTGSATAPQAMGHWLAVRLQQSDGNRDAIGAVVEVRSGGLDIRREVTVGGGHISGQLVPTHVGLGGGTAAEVRVQWPDGTRTPWLPTNVDRTVTVDRASGALQDPGTAP